MCFVIQALVIYICQRYNHCFPIKGSILYGQKELDAIRLAKMLTTNNNLCMLFRLGRKSYQFFATTKCHFAFGKAVARSSIIRITFYYENF